MNMKIMVMDGQGGNIGRQLVKRIIELLPQAELTVVGTNSVATENMIKAGAQNAATGENAAIVACRKADIIVGPIGIVVADALMGEVTPAMATAVGQSDAVRILIPLNRCETLVAGVGSGTATELINDAIQKIISIAENN